MQNITIAYKIMFFSGTKLQKGQERYRPQFFVLFLGIPPPPFIRSLVVEGWMNGFSGLKLPKNGSHFSKIINTHM